MWLQASKKQNVSYNSHIFTNQQKQVQAFIDMIYYLSKFSPRFSELAKQMREVSKDKVPFNWEPEFQEAFTQMKKEILSALVLAYYKTKEQTMLQTDASIKGLGACLLQEEKPICFATKVLTEAEKGYVAIEIESLSVTLVMEKFHHFYMPVFSP